MLLPRRVADFAAPPLVVDHRPGDEHAGVIVLLPDVSESARRAYLAWQIGNQDRANPSGNVPALFIIADWHRALR